MNRWKKDFIWFEKNPNLTYLDTAATSLKPNTVLESINNYYTNQSTNPHNDDSSFTFQAKKVMQEARLEVSKLVNCESNEIIFTSGATESLVFISQSIKNILKKGDEIIISRLEHSSNLLPWYKLRDEIGVVLKFIEEKSLNLDPNSLKKILSDKTKVVSFTGASNLTGIMTDVQLICDTVKNFNHDILICLDIAQMIPHAFCDLKKWNCDFAAFSGHKMFSPTGIGVAFIKANLQETITPLRFGGGMNSTVTENDFCYIDGNEKFEGGTPNISGIYGILEATKYLNKITYENIYNHEENLNLYFSKKFKEENIKDLVWVNNNSKSATFIFNIKGIFSQDLAHYLGNNNIIVRSGLSCAKLMNNVINETGVVRASFYIYNTTNDIDTLFNSLKKFKKEDILNGII